LSAGKRGKAGKKRAKLNSGIESPETPNPKSETRNPETGNLKPGTSSLEFGAWNLEFGI
jgi:hypothetical protein